MEDSDAAPHYRRSIRLRDYDYSQPGAYYVTICTHERRCLFGKIADSEVRLNSLGHAIRHHWQDLPNHHAGVELDEYVVMPNHLHGIVVIGESSGEIVGMPAEGEAGLAPTPAVVHSRRKPTLASVIGSFKSACTRTINRQLERPITLWQRGYYEHVIRSEAALARIRQYIEDNPATWALDRDNPANWRQ